MNQLEKLTESLRIRDSHTIFHWGFGIFGLFIPYIFGMIVGSITDSTTYAVVGSISGLIFVVIVLFLNAYICERRVRKLED